MNSSNSINFKDGWDALNFEEKRAARILSGLFDETDSTKEPDMTTVTKALDRGHDISVQLVKSLTAKGFLSK